MPGTTRAGNIETCTTSTACYRWGEHRVSEERGVVNFSVTARGDGSRPSAEVWEQRATLCPLQSFLCRLSEIWYRQSPFTSGYEMCEVGVMIVQVRCGLETTPRTGATCGCPFPCCSPWVSLVSSSWVQTSEGFSRILIQSCWCDGTR